MASARDKSSRADRLRYQVLFVGGLGLLLVLLCAVLWQVLSRQGSADPTGDLEKTVLGSLIGTLVTTLSIGALIKWLSKQDERQTTENVMVSIFSDTEGEIFKRIDPAARREMLVNLFRAHLPGEYSRQLANEISAGYFGTFRSYRSDFRYVIVYSSAAPSISADASIKDLVAAVTAPGDAYYWVSQSISYQQQEFIDERREYPDAVVQLAFDDAALEEMLRDPQLLFREVIHLTDDHKAQAEALTDEQLKAFVRDVLEFSVVLGLNNDRVTPDYEVKWKVAGHGHRYIEIRMPNSFGTREGLYSKIDFRYPNRRSVVHFVVMAPRPLSSASISFTAADTMRGLSFYPFVSQFGQANYTPGISGTRANPRTITIESAKDKVSGKDKWWFPTSGFMFVWELENRPAAVPIVVETRQTKRLSAPRRRRSTPAEGDSA